MFDLFKIFRRPVQVVDLTNPTWQAILGNYFIGQTEEIYMVDNNNAWAALINPINSGVTLFFDIFTISNFSRQSFTAEVWLNSTLPSRGILSKNVTSANQSINPPPQPRVEMQYADHILKPPTGGIYSFTRRVEPNYTLTRHDFQGMIIIPPGGSVIIYLNSSGKGTIQSAIAFGWWEQECKVSQELRGRILHYID